MIVTYNIAYLYEKLNRKAEAIKYYTLLRNSADPEFKEIGHNAIKELSTGK